MLYSNLCSTGSWKSKKKRKRLHCILVQYYERGDDELNKFEEKVDEGILQRYFSVCEFYFFVLHTLYLYSFFLFFAFSVSFCCLTFMRVDLLYYSARLSTINFQCYRNKDLKSRFNRFFILASKLHVNTITVSCVKIIPYCWIKLVVTLLYPSSTKVLITSMHTFGCYSTYMLGLS